MTIKRIDGVSSRGKAYHYYTIDGKSADGVTTAIGKALPKPALMKWAPRAVAEFVADNPLEVEALRAGPRDRMVNELKEAPYRERDAAANRGTEVHALAERLVRGDEVEVPDELSSYVDSYVRFLNEWQPKPVHVEMVVASRKWMYAGTVDLVADLPNDERGLMDLKTGKGVYPDVALQLAAYTCAECYLDDDGNEHPIADLGINAVYVVHVRPGGYEVRRVEIADAWKVFQHLLWISRRIGDQMNPWLGDAVPPMNGGGQ